MKTKLKSLLILTIIAVMLLSSACVAGDNSGGASKEIYGFKLIKEQDIPDFSSTLLWYEHERTGAELVWIKNSDEFKTFSICFKTEPYDDTGSAHIVEHALVTSSRKYSSNNVILDMYYRSTCADMNAYTAPDHTWFPLSSRDSKDFANLTDLYLDMIIFPRIGEDESLFRREGWHYDIMDKSDPINYVGIVYNEMRGYMSNPEEKLENAALKALYPDTGYAFNSGGDPEAIPDLSYEEFLAFYHKFYHPSNMLLYFYGDVDIEYFMKKIDEEYLSEFDKQEPEVELKKQEPFSGMSVVEDEYNISEGEDTAKKTYLAYVIGCGDGGNLKDDLSLGIIGDALRYMNSAPIKNRLMDENIGEDVGSMSFRYNQNAFGVAVSEAEPEDADRLVKIVDEELNRVVKDGFDKKTLYSIINRIEIRLREGGGGLKGNFFLDYVKNGRFYSGDPAAYFDFSGVIDELKEGVENGYFENFVKEKLLSHNHKGLAILKPSAGLFDRHNKAVEEKLAKYKASLSDEELEELISVNKKDAEKNSASTDINLPKLELSEIDTDINVEDYTVSDLGKSKLLYSEQPTNGMVYASLQFDLSTVDEDKLPYAAILSYMLKHVDTEAHKREELDVDVSVVSGGIYASLHVNEHSKTQALDSRFKINTKATGDYLDETFDLVYEILMQSKFEDYDWIGKRMKRIETVAQEAVSTNGNFMGLYRALSYFSPKDKYWDAVGGFDFLRSVQKINKDFEKDPKAVCDEIKSVAETVFNSENLIVTIVSDEENFKPAKKTLKAFIDKLPDRKQRNGKFNIKCEVLNEGVPSYSDTNYVFMAGNLKEAMGKEVDGSVYVLPNILNSTYLIPELRLKGGAYSPRMYIEKNTNIVFYTYDDPNITETLDVFRKAGDFISTLEIDQEELEKIIISYFKSTPSTPEQIADNICYRYITGISDEELRLLNEQVKNAKLETIKEFGEGISRMLENEKFLVIGMDSKVRENSEIFKNIFEVSE